jgi:hypothetical protein
MAKMDPSAADMALAVWNDYVQYDRRVGHGPHEWPVGYMSMCRQSYAYKLCGTIVITPFSFFKGI